MDVLGQCLVRYGRINIYNNCQKTEKKKEIEMKDSSTVYRFGDEKCAALHNVTAPD